MKELIKERWCLAANHANGNVYAPVTLIDSSLGRRLYQFSRNYFAKSEISFFFWKIVLLLMYGRG